MKISAFCSLRRKITTTAQIFSAKKSSVNEQATLVFFTNNAYTENEVRHVRSIRMTSFIRRRARTKLIWQYAEGSKKSDIVFSYWFFFNKLHYNVWRQKILKFCYLWQIYNLSQDVVQTFDQLFRNSLKGKLRSGYIKTSPSLIHSGWSRMMKTSK